LDIVAKEKSTLKVTVAFTDEDGNAVTPTALTWTLTDSAGTVINDREDEEVATPGASNAIALSGNDLAIQSGEAGTYVERRILVEAVYTSDLGAGLPLKWAGAFLVENLAGVS
jgi:hypothetical protein